MIFKVPTCIIVYLPLEEIIPGKSFQTKYSITQLIPWNIFLRDGSFWVCLSISRYQYCLWGVKHPCMQQNWVWSILWSQNTATPCPSRSKLYSHVYENVLRSQPILPQVHIQDHRAGNQRNPKRKQQTPTCRWIKAYSFVPHKNRIYAQNFWFIIFSTGSFTPVPQESHGKIQNPRLNHLYPFIEMY